MTTKITDKGAARLLKLMKDLKADVADVGALDPETAAKLVFAEFGTERAPARPVIRQMIDRRRDALGKTMAEELDAMIALGRDRHEALERIGASVAAELRAAIYAFSDPPNAESTILKKLKNDPLVDSGKMAERITFRIAKRGR